ncbi:MAG TPA: serine/threonine-protein kinase [Patescibacteria group bacterium]|nr:serine/threonine-protein kinase [Patescibacteria group bacterium]
MKICRVCQSQFPDDQTTCAKDGTDLHSATDIQPGTVLGGKYEIICKVGEGGMGAVFKAKRTSDGTIWALKVVAHRLVEEAGFRQRFKSEALIMQALNHPNDVRVVDYLETEEGQPITVMEFVDGPHLDELVPAGTKMDIARAVNLVIQLVDGLGAAHKMTIIHRDVKPDNVMVAKDANGKEIAKLLDFGVAKVKEAGELFASQKTAAGVMIGTPAYMSPEQVKGVPSDQLTGAVDLYAAAVILFELLCGRPPFVEKKPVMMLMAHAATPPPDPRQFRKDIPAPLAEAILKALQKDPTQRFANAEEMHQALAASLAPAAAAAAATPVAAASPAPPPAAPAPPAKPAIAPPPAPTAPPRPAAAPPPPPPPPAPAPAASARPAAAAPPPTARPATKDPEATAQRESSKLPPAPAPVQPAAQPAVADVQPARTSVRYYGTIPKPYGTQQKKPKRHWVRVIVILFLLASLIGAVIWYLAPKNRKLWLSSELHSKPAAMQSVAHSGHGSDRIPSQFS